MPQFLVATQRIVRHFLPLHAGRLRVIFLLGIAAALLNGAGYLVLHPLIDYLTGNQVVIVLGPWRLAPDTGGFILVTALIVGLLAGSLQLKYGAHTAALAIFRQTVGAAAVEGLLAFRRLPTPPTRRPDQYLYRASQEITGPIAFACGFTMKQAALGIADLVQLIVFTTMMAWLSPWLTLAFLATAAGVGLFYIGALRRVAERSGNRSALAREVRAELRELSSDLADPAFAEVTLRNRLTGLYRHGASGRLLASKLDIRHEIKRGPLLIEYLFPVALIVLPVVALATGSFKAIAGNLIVYLLLLRQTIASLQSLSALLISVGRYQAQLTCFDDLIGGVPAPGCRFRNQDDGDRDDDEPAG